MRSFRSLNLQEKIQLYVKTIRLIEGCRRGEVPKKAVGTTNFNCYIKDGITKVNW